VPSIKLTRKGIVIEGDLRDIPAGQGYFVPSLNPSVTERELRALLTGRWRYRYVVMKGMLGVLVEPIGQGKPVGTAAPAQSAAAPPDE
jgi:hypothetical protein